MRVRTVRPIAAMIAVAFMGSVVVTPLYPLYEKDFGFSPLVLTLVYAVYAAGNLLALLVFGQLADQLGRKRVALPAMGVAALGTGCFLVANGPVLLGVGRLLVGVAVGILSSAGTAWIAERYGPQRHPTASVVSATANTTGIALGPLLGGVLAQYTSLPLRIPLIVYLVVLALVAAFLVFARDDRAAQVHRISELRLTPRIGLPRDRLGAFAAPALTAFITFALGGLFFALIPGIVRGELHIANVAVAGIPVGELGAVAAIVIVVARRLAPATAMRTGLVLLIPAVALVVIAQGLRSLPLLLVASAVCGAALALGYRGGLQVVNDVAGDERRGQVTAGYMICFFVGNSVPVIGVGLLTTVADPLVASVAFAVLLVVLAVAALQLRTHQDSAPARDVGAGR
jgi:MFS family permease